MDIPAESSSESLFSPENLPAPLWLVHGWPRIAINQVIAERYRVVSIQQSSGRHQLLHVVGSTPSKAHFVHVVKVIQRNLVHAETMRSQLNWLYSGQDRFVRSHLLCDFLDDNNLHYLVFHRSSVTLSKVLRNPQLMPLPERHVRELFLQLITTLQCLHKQAVIHSDLCPDNVELIDAFVTTQAIYDADTGDFTNRSVLSCVKVRLSFYGDLGLRFTGFGRDQYRSPEVVFRQRASVDSDCFSLGCVLGEIILGDPVFPRCESGPLYEQEKALLFNAISGPFSQSMATRAETLFPRTFDELTIRPICYKGISRETLANIKKAVPVRWMLEDMQIAEVVEGLVCTDPEERNTLEETLASEYFAEDDM